MSHQGDLDVVDVIFFMKGYNAAMMDVPIIHHNFYKSTYLHRISLNINAVIALPTFQIEAMTPA